MVVQGPDDDYALREFGGDGNPFQARPGHERFYAHAYRAVELKPGEPDQEVDLALRRGAAVHGHAVDPEGRPVRDAQIFCRLVVPSMAIGGWRLWHPMPARLLGHLTQPPGQCRRQRARLHLPAPTAAGVAGLVHAGLAAEAEHVLGLEHGGVRGRGEGEPDQAPPRTPAVGEAVAADVDDRQVVAARVPAQPGQPVHHPGVRRPGPEHQSGVELTVKHLALLAEDLLDLLGAPVVLVDGRGRPDDDPVEAAVGLDGVQAVAGGEDVGRVAVLGLAELALPGGDYDLTSLRTALAWGYGHYVCFAAAAALGAGLGVAIDTLDHHAHLSERGAAASVAIPVVVFLIMLAGLHQVARTGAIGHPMLIAAGVIIVILVALSAPALGLAIAVLLMGVAVAATLVASLALTAQQARHPERI